ncbi:MAG: MBOAT family O-acyltransferase [Eubacteriales bacterium]
MLFNSYDFFIFFPIVVMIYFVIPRNIRYIWLLVASYYFYMSWNPMYVILIATSTLITYGSGLAIERIAIQGREHSVRNKKIIVGCSVVLNLAILVIFKYSNFIINTLNSILFRLNVQVIEKSFDLLLPVGISFYTFQALSYTVDVYRGTISSEKNVLKYALYVSFFPQLVAGPIERSSSLMGQIRRIEHMNLWSEENTLRGLLMMAWGFFQKLVIADRIAVIVNQVYRNYEQYGFVEISIAVALFAIQVYCDFDGYTNIARGAAKIMGFDLMKNFKRPYFAQNIKDFWRRWHISLTSWFTDYVYIPLGGNRLGIKRTYWNIMLVFFLSGLWHGAGYKFIVWGLLHGLYQICGIIKSKYISPKWEQPPIWVKGLNIVITFLLVDFAWIFFSASSLSSGIRLIKQMVTNIRIDNLLGRILELGLDGKNILILCLSICILLVVDFLQEIHFSIFEWICKQFMVVRYAIYVIVFWYIVLLGYYGPAYDASQFIYFQF